MVNGVAAFARPAKVAATVLAAAVPIKWRRFIVYLMSFSMLF
jgi:hypothetical protein